ncbi:hypothetical protein [Spiroplasma eriocheiris]|uniref:Uncharacterized protein n=1 Tax=Spiroplasma eriocheiris TaxID=315358 RepID=A0A0H3XMA9_9MOLU|nr:hypothetical protein [Spiroplasma eriocheiris]AHF57575.1 hypothetical protein SPE_0446 [Spiroplasma eriocheiris CCTCC M 207170]AKM54032.1 hypothetical protein SERIO_v1c04530 [Spiroplasma eriocheiris]
MEHKNEKMSLKEEKIEQSLNELMAIIKSLDQDASDLQERASLKVYAAQEDYEDIKAEIDKIQEEINKLEYQFDLSEISFYLIFLDLKLSFNILKNKLEVTKYLIQIFSSQK